MDRTGEIQLPAGPSRRARSTTHPVQHTPLVSESPLSLASSRSGIVVRVAIIAELRLYRDGLAELLDARDGIHVIAAYARGDEAVTDIEQLLPDVALVDMAMIDNIETIRALVRRTPTVKILALGLPETEQVVLPCVEAGIAAYVSRDGTLDDVASAVHRIMRGEALCPPEIVASLFRRVTALAMQPRDGEGASMLTRRELQIASLIAAGLSNKEIARELHIEVSTVKNHVHNAFEKLQVRRRAQMVARLDAALGTGI
jgi:two-component system nitrate/nitrite response regulator NarL